ncbi:hypothetical protein SLE2022_385450 [Rubroshorea leprosula]
MKIVTFNTRGLANSIKRRELRSMVHQEQINLLMIQETKAEIVDEQLCRSIWGQGNFEWCAKSSNGRAGGLLCIWDSSLFEKTRVIEGEGFLGVEGLWGISKATCCFVNVYGPCNVAGRAKLWEDLSTLIGTLNCFFCLGGDFNCVRGMHERKGKMISHPGSDDFNLFIESNCLVDLPLSNRKFSWYKCDGLAHSRLDRFLLSKNYLECWGNCVQLALKRSISDHCPISLVSDIHNWGPKPFRFINSWSLHPEFNHLIEKLWSSFEVEGYWGFKCKEKLRRLKQHLKKWNKEVFGNIDSQLEQAMKKVDFVDRKCEDQDLSEEDVLKRKDGFEELWLCLKKKESLWRQKSRVTWIKEGDANTAYFHKFVNSRRKKNMLHGVNNQGSWIDDPIQVKQIVYDHFKSQYSSQSTQQVQPSFDHLQFCRLSEEDRILLEVEFTDDEIREAVSSCASDKAPGPDGFNFHFIKSAWGTVGADIINFIKEFHQNARLVKGINSSYITLVPKKKNPTSLKEFRPICTIGSMYKILAKVLANRLKMVIAKIISASQSAFIKGRQLVDCSFALNEIIHDLKIKRRKGIVFKADFEKAFDSVDWGYLDKMLSYLGFGEKWRSWIKECLRSASISILVNGSPTEEFNMQRGLRQGDPLSPYLFLIVAEGFHALLLEAEKKDVFKGVVIDDKTSISHLQFADDTALICEASINSILAIKYALRWFEIMSGLRINFNKSVLIGINVDETWISMAASALNCKAGKTPFIYLGLPVGGNPHRHSFWKPVIEKFRSKLASWKGKLLSIGGRITLLTSVLSALPLFYFSIFKVPKGILKELIRIQKNFLWGTSDESKKIAWVNWERVCLAKNKGGLGIPNLAIKNIALLGKWWDKFYDDAENEKLWKKITISKYYSGTSTVSISNTTSSKISAIWKDILSISRDCERNTKCFSEGFSRQLGDGYGTRFWKDAWVETSPLMLVFPRLFKLTLGENLLVADLKPTKGEGWIL